MLAIGLGSVRVTREVGRVRVTFRVSSQGTLDDFIDLYEWRDGEWVFVKGNSVTPLPLLHEAEISGLLREGKRDEIEQHRHPEAISAIVDYVDLMLKGMGWRRASEVHTFPLDEPMRQESAANRWAEFDVRRGWRERRYLVAVRRAIKAQRDGEGHR